jgi:hypothetical protein
MIIDCDTCAIRGSGCADCVVTALIGSLPQPGRLDDDEREALHVLASAGLVAPLRLVAGPASEAAPRDAPAGSAADPAADSAADSAMADRRDTPRRRRPAV